MGESVGVLSGTSTCSSGTSTSKKSPTGRCSVFMTPPYKLLAFTMNLILFSFAKPRNSPRWWQWSNTFVSLGAKGSSQIQHSILLIRFGTCCPNYTGNRLFAKYTSRAISCSFSTKFVMQFSELSITNSFGVEKPFSIKVRPILEGMCCPITSVKDASGLAGQDDTGISNDSKSH